MSEEQMDDAAHELLYMRQDDAPIAAALETTGHSGSISGRPPFYEHLGGYSMHELHDFNRHSNPLIATTSSSGSGVLWWWHRRRHRAARSQNTTPKMGLADETTMYITSV